MRAPAPDSNRLALAKDYIADEQWGRAIAELRAVAEDANDANRDEALFWLAPSQHQVGDQASSISTIARLERLFPRSPWVRPARSLRVEIAQRLNRDDVLWVLAAPPAPPTAPTPGLSGQPPTPAPMALPPRAMWPGAPPKGRTPVPPPGEPTVLAPPVAATPAVGATPPPAPPPPGV